MQSCAMLRIQKQECESSVQKLSMKHSKVTDFILLCVYPCPITEGINPCPTAQRQLDCPMLSLCDCTLLGKGFSDLWIFLHKKYLSDPQTGICRNTWTLEEYLQLPFLFASEGSPPPPFFQTHSTRGSWGHRQLSCLERRHLYWGVPVNALLGPSFLDLCVLRLSPYDSTLWKKPVQTINSRTESYRCSLGKNRSHLLLSGNIFSI